MARFDWPAKTNWRSLLFLCLDYFIYHEQRNRFRSCSAFCFSWYSFFFLSNLAMSLRSTTDEPSLKSSRDLRRAFNAALTRIIDSGEFLRIKNDTGMSEVLACVTCSPDSSQSNYPSKDAITGRLADIFQVRNKEYI